MNEEKFAICGGCDKKVELGPNDDAHKPRLWYSREDSDGRQIACSRECIDVIAAKTGKTSVVLPF